MSPLLFTRILTHSSNNLALKTELVAETSGKVADATLAVARNVGNLTNVVEHMAAGEEQHSDQAERSPQVTVLQNGDDVGRSDDDEGENSKDGGGHGDDLDPVNRTGDLGLRRIGGELAGDPGVDLLSRLGTMQCQKPVTAFG